MLSAAFIVFREVLEAALLIGIMAAAVKTLPRARWWIFGGVALGLLASGAVAGVADLIAQAADGAGQELFNVAVLGLAVMMLAWHNIWMARHGKELAHATRQTAQSVVNGHAELSAVAIVVFFAVLREGSETALFIFGLAAGGQLPARELWAGVAIGICTGALIGLALYLGLVRVPIRKLFAISSAVLLLIAAGMAGQMARLLEQADLLSAGSEPVWDTSWLLSTDSVLGNLLHKLAGYEAQPSTMQLAFYLGALALIGAGMFLSSHTMARRAVGADSKAKSNTPSFSAISKIS